MTYLGFNLQGGVKGSTSRVTSKARRQGAYPYNPDTSEVDARLGPQVCVVQRRRCAQERIDAKGESDEREGEAGEDDSGAGGSKESRTAWWLDVHGKHVPLSPGAAVSVKSAGPWVVL